MKAEPVTVTTLINAGFAACVAVAVGFFNFEPSDQQVAALATVQMFTILALGYFTRQRVTPTDELPYDWQRELGRRG